MTLNSWFVLRCSLGSPGLTQVDGPFAKYEEAVAECARDNRWGASIILNGGLAPKIATQLPKTRLIGGEV